MTKGCLFWFCSEWQRARRVIVPDYETFQELRIAINASGELTGRSVWVQQAGLEGWFCDVAEAVESGLLGAEGQHPPLPPLPPSPWPPETPDLDGPLSPPPSPMPSAARPEAGAGGPYRGSPMHWSRDSAPSRGPSDRGPRGLDGAARGELSVGALLLQLPGDKGDKFINATVAARCASPCATPSRQPDRAATPSASRAGTPGPRSATPSAAKRPWSVGKAVTQFSGAAQRARARSPSPSLNNASQMMDGSLTSRGTCQQSETKTRLMPLHVWNASHALMGLPEHLNKVDFTDEIRKRLRAPALFKYAQAMQTEAVLSVEEAEELWEALMVLQDNSGEGIQLTMNRRFDATVEQFFCLNRLRYIMERAAPSFRAFFSILDLDTTGEINVDELSHFMRNMAASADQRLSFGIRTADVRRVAEVLLSILDVNRDSKIDFWEICRQLSIVAPPGASLFEIASYFELKYGHGKVGPAEMLSHGRMYNRFCKVETVDYSPEDTARFFGVWRGSSQLQTLQSATWEAALRRMQWEVSWDANQETMDRIYCALGVRVLQKERLRKRDACLPADAIIEAARTVEELPPEADLRVRFDRLWSRCVPNEGGWASGSVLAEELKEGCFAKYLEAAKRSVGDANLAVTGGSSSSGALAYAPPLPQIPRFGPRSLFPNIVDVLAVPSTRLYAGQTVLVRYRLQGAANFVSPEHGVLQDGRDVIPWPVPLESLGETPFIGLVPRGLRWTGAGGGGFYLGKDPFSSVDPTLRTDLPKDAHSGRLVLYGHVELVPPSPARHAVTGMLDGDAAKNYELRLFCSRKGKIIGCVGDPVYVTVESRPFPKPIESMQVRLEGRRATLRWTMLDLGPMAPETPVKEVRLYMRGGKTERDVCLEPGTTEWEVSELQHDTEYEFRVRCEGTVGWGREAGLVCRTNNRCSEPKNVSRPTASTTHVELSWEPPDVVGNETTRDRMQATHESVLRYEGVLHVEDQDGGSLPQSDPADEAGGGGEQFQGRTLVFPAGTWKQGPGRTTAVQLQGLRPDQRYSLRGLCAVNSVGAGIAAKPLTFFTLPQVPKLIECRVKTQRVLIKFILSNAIRLEYEVTVALTSKPKDVKSLAATFVGPKVSPGEQLVEGQQCEVSFPFVGLSTAEQNGTHTLRLRAKNAGGWSEWSEPLQTPAIARQQCADHVQGRLIEAVQLHEIDMLQQVTTDAQGIEFTDERPLTEALKLLNALTAAKQELDGAVAFREPERLLKALEHARSVGLPRLGPTEALLRRLTSVKQQLDEAKGIDALKAALSAAYDAELHSELIQEAVDRLGSREAAHHNVKCAMEASRVPGLIAAIEASVGMSLPIEQEARRHLSALQCSELLLHAGLETGLIVDLAIALDSVAESGLREDELVAKVEKLKQELEEQRGRATDELEQAIEARFPERLRAGIEWSESAQVDEALVDQGRELADFLEDLLEQAYGAVGVEDRDKHLQTAKGGDVPESLVRSAEEQLLRLREVIKAHIEGDLPATRRCLKLATTAGVKDVELAQIRVDFAQWHDSYREMELAVAMARTAPLRKCIDAAFAVGIQPAQLLWAQQVLIALELRDKAEAQLSVAIEERDCDKLRKALKRACDTNSQDKALIDRARCDLTQLVASRHRLKQAVQGGDLRTIFLALKQAKVPPALPPHDVQEAKELFEKLKENESELFHKRFKQAESESDFRAMDALAARGELLRKSSVDIPTATIDRARELARDYQEAERRAFEEEVHSARALGEKTAGAVEFKTIKNAELFKVPVEHDVADLPYAVILGDMHLAYQAYGVHLCVLPREIIHMRASVVAREVEDEDTGEVIIQLEEAYEMLDKVVHNLQAMLEPEDNIRRMTEYTEVHDGAHQRVELNLSLYLGAKHSAHEVTEALFERRQMRLVTLNALPVAKEFLPRTRSMGLEKNGQKTKLRKSMANLKTTVNHALVKMKMVIGPDAADTKPGRHATDCDVARHDLAEPIMEVVADQLGAHLSRVWTETALTDCMSDASSEEGSGLYTYVDKALSIVMDPTPAEGCLYNVRPRVLRELTLDFSWTYPVGMMDNLDISCYVFDDEKLVDILTHDGKSTKAASDSRLRTIMNVQPSELAGMVKHIGDVSDRTSRKGCKQVVLRMDLIPPRVRDVVFVLSVHNSANLAKFDNIKVEVHDPEADAQFATFIIGNGTATESLTLCSVSCLSDNLWHLLGLAEASNGNHRDPRLVLDKLLFLGYPRNVSLRNQEPHILESMQKTLDFMRPPKRSQLTVSPLNQMKLSYVFELIYGETEAHEASNLARLLTKQAIVTEMVTAMQVSGAMRFQSRHIDMYPAKPRKMKKVHVELAWKYPDPEDIVDEERDCNFLDIVAMAFSGRALQEVVDYRGAHGVRLVHNGVFDESGVWLGKVGVGDATDGQVSYLGDELDDLSRKGLQRILIDLTKLPPSTTDVVLAATSPVVQDIGLFQDVELVIRDAENVGHEVERVTLPETTTIAEAAILCRLSRLPDDDQHWQLGAFRSVCGGSTIDYRPLIAHVRNIQERKHGSTNLIWKHRIARLADPNAKKTVEKVDKMADLFAPLMSLRQTMIEKTGSSTPTYAASSRRRSAF